MNLQTKVLINSDQRELINSIESGFPYLTVSGVLEAHCAHKSSLDYWKKHLQNSPVSQKDNFRVCIIENVPWHWHQEFEFCNVIKGSCKLCLPNQEFILYEGDAIFINANCLHMAARIDVKTEVIYHTQQFRKELLEGTSDSVFRGKYINPVLESNLIQGILFRHNAQKQAHMISIMERAYQTYLIGDTGYELIIRNLISELWVYIVREHKNELDPSVKCSSTVNERIKAMMTFIEHNYMNKISVDNIGDAANVSKREC